MKTEKYVVSIFGHFGGDNNFLDGQTIKTKTIANVISNSIGDGNVYLIDTFGWKSDILSLINKILTAFKNSKNIVILPGKNGVKIFAPLFCIINEIYRRKLFYIVIGGWLPEYAKERPLLRRTLKKFNRIFVETSFMKEKLENVELFNVCVMPNFKQINVLKEPKIKVPIDKPFKLCTFSRVMKEKGIEDAIEAVIRANLCFREEVFNLDIFGQIEQDYRYEFSEILKNSPNYIKYKGTVPYEKSVEILQEYYLLLFPTYYVGEGFAGTLLDALASGLPVIASDWRYNSEIVIDGKTGRLFPAKDIGELVNLLCYYANHQEEVIRMRRESLENALNYLPENAIKYLLDRF